MNITLEKLQQTVANIESCHSLALERILKNMQNPEHCFYKKHSLCREQLSVETDNHLFMLYGLRRLFGLESDEGAYITPFLDTFRLKWLDSESVRSGIQFSGDES
jgi:hypothetical protein